MIPFLFFFNLTLRFVEILQVVIHIQESCTELQMSISFISYQLLGNIREEIHDLGFFTRYKMPLHYVVPNNTVYLNIILLSRMRKLAIFREIYRNNEFPYPAFGKLISFHYCISSKPYSLQAVDQSLGNTDLSYSPDRPLCWIWYRIFFRTCL